MSIMQCRHASYVPSRCVTARARRRVTDYSARRAGGEEENRRRSRASREYQPFTEQRGYQNGTGPRRSEDYSRYQNGSGSYTSYESQAATPSAAVVPGQSVGSRPPIMRKRSTDYSSRRPGGEEENLRRSGDFRSPTQAPQRQAPTSYTESPASSQSAYSAPPARTSQPRIQQKRRSVDYASRRAGGEEENLRRSQDFSTPGRKRGSSREPVTRYDYTPPRTRAADDDEYRPRGNGSRVAGGSQPPIMRKRSTDYSARRSGGEEENLRRSGDFRSPTQTPRRQSRSSYTADAPLSGAQSAYSAPPARTSQPRIVPKRRSQDYPSRRSGGQEENQRRSQDFSSPGRKRGASREPVTRYDYTPPRTRGPVDDEPRSRGGGGQDFVPLTDTGARDSGYGGAQSPGSSRSTNYSPRNNGYLGLNENSPPTRAGRANAERRRSGSYNERRSSNISEENSRRRSVDMITGEIQEPSREGPPPGRRMVGGYDSAPESSPSYSVSKKVKGVPRPSKDFLAASEADAWQKRLNPEEKPQVTAGQVDGPWNPAETDWPRVIAGNLPAAFLVFAGIAATDIYTGFGITRIAVRYGGPGAPPGAVVAFWPTAIAAAGVLSALLTNLLQLEAFGLKAKCPECGNLNRAGFKGGIRGPDNLDAELVECDNCMAELRFDLASRRVVVQRGSEEKKKDALERGRQQALRIARMEAEAAQKEAQQYMDKDSRI